VARSKESPLPTHTSVNLTHRPNQAFCVLPYAQFSQVPGNWVPRNRYRAVIAVLNTYRRSARAGFSMACASCVSQRYEPVRFTARLSNTAPRLLHPGLRYSADAPRHLRFAFPLQPFLFFFWTDYMDSPAFTVTSERIRFSVA